MKEIEGHLDGWAPSFDEYYLYELWENYRILPHSGGWLDQPVWVHELYRKAGLFDEYLTLNSKLPSAAGMPSLRDIAKGP